MISQMRKWVDTRGGGGPFPNAGPPAPLSKEEAIDRLHQHTLTCPSCSGVRPPADWMIFEQSHIILDVACAILQLPAPFSEEVNIHRLHWDTLLGRGRGERFLLTRPILVTPLSSHISRTKENGSPIQALLPL